MVFEDSVGDGIVENQDYLGLREDDKREKRENYYLIHQYDIFTPSDLGARE